MKQRDKMVVTLSMVWIGIMALLTVPKWVRDARDFVSGSTGHGISPSPSQQSQSTSRVTSRQEQIGGR